MLKLNYFWSQFYKTVKIISIPPPPLVFSKWYEILVAEVFEKVGDLKYAKLFLNDGNLHNGLVCSAFHNAVVNKDVKNGHI